MVINEKGLIDLMKAAFKKRSTGYKVACRVSNRKECEIVLAGPGWFAVMERENTPRKVLALIVEHLGNLPLIGQAYQVQDKQTQAEIFDMAVPELPFLEESNAPRIARTQLTYQGYRVWQRSDDLKVHLVSENMEALLLNYNQPLAIADNGMFYTCGAVSRVYISRVPIMRDEYPGLDHLAKQQWV